MATTAASPATLCRLVSRHDFAGRTTAFCFEKPLHWTFKAGQFLDMTLLEPAETDAEGNTRTFCIASAPHEETLEVATRMGNTAFKRVLNTLPPGSVVKIDGPSGSLTGIDDEDLVADLQREGADSFVASWKDLLDCIETKAAALAGALA